MPSTSTLVPMIQRLTRSATPEAMVADADQNIDIDVTFVYSSLTGNTKVVNGVTWYEATGTWTFNPLNVEITYGSTGKIKIKRDSASTNGWKLVSFIPKSSNPSGGPGQAGADGNGDITFTDANTVAGTYSYGIYMENSGQKQYASFDPTIKQDGGGTPPMEP